MFDKLLGASLWFAAAVPCGNGGQTCEAGIPEVAASNSQLKTIMQIVFAILGGLAFLVIIIGALRYTISGGNPESVKNAKNTVIYALVGLIVCVSAEIIVTFVLGRL